LRWWWFAVLGLTDVGGRPAGVIAHVPEEEVDAHPLDLVSLGGVLQLLPRNLHGLHGATGDLGDADTAGIAAREEDLNGFGALIYHVLIYHVLIYHVLIYHL
jgi:hypothetical protein